MRHWQAPTRRTALFLALLAVTGPALHAEDAMNSTSSHFAYIGTYNPNGEGVYRVQVDPASGATLPEVAEGPVMRRLVPGPAACSQRKPGACSRWYTAS